MFLLELLSSLIPFYRTQAILERLAALPIPSRAIAFPSAPSSPPTPRASHRVLHEAQTVDDPRINTATHVARNDWQLTVAKVRALAQLLTMYARVASRRKHSGTAAAAYMVEESVSGACTTTEAIPARRQGQALM